jgi:RimJ/RimL family protein N-acetyltransferase
MDPTKTWIADLPPDEHRPADERVLVIEFDAKSGGWFVFTCRTGLGDVKWDDWSETFDGALAQAERYGVGRGAWREYADQPASCGTRLRPTTERDLRALFEFSRDPESVRMAAFTANDPSDRAQFYRHWTKLLADPTVRARTVVADGVVVGSVIAFDADLGREVTYWIGRAHWGRGLASAALAALLVEETTRPLFARASKDNVGSIRVLEKNGFRVVGADRFFANARGAEIDEVVLRLDG